MKEVHLLESWANQIIAEKTGRDDSLPIEQDPIKQVQRDYPYLDPREAISKTLFDLKKEVDGQRKENERLKSQISNISKGVSAPTAEPTTALQTGTQDGASKKDLMSLSTDIENYKNSVVDTYAKKPEVKEIMSDMASVKKLLGKVEVNQVEPEIIKKVEQKIEQLDRRYPMFNIKISNAEDLGKYMTAEDYSQLRKLIGELEAAYQKTTIDVDGKIGDLDKKYKSVEPQLKNQIGALEAKINQRLIDSQKPLSDRVDSIDGIVNNQKAIISNLNKVVQQFPQYQKAVTAIESKLKGMGDDIDSVVQWGNGVDRYIQELKTGSLRTQDDLANLRKQLSSIDTKNSTAKAEIDGKIENIFKQFEISVLTPEVFERIKKQVQDAILKGSQGDLRQILINTKDRLGRDQAKEIEDLLNRKQFKREDGSTFKPDVRKQKAMKDIWSLYRPSFTRGGSAPKTPDPYKTPINVAAVKRIVNDQLDDRLGDIETVIDQIQSGEPVVSTDKSSPSKKPSGSTLTQVQKNFPSIPNYSHLESRLNQLALRKGWYDIIRNAFYIDVAVPLDKSPDNDDEIEDSGYPNLSEAFIAMAYQMWSLFVGSTIKPNKQTIGVMEEWFIQFTRQSLYYAAKQTLEPENNEELREITDKTTQTVFNNIMDQFDEYKNKFTKKVGGLSESIKDYKKIKDKKPPATANLPQRVSYLEKNQKNHELFINDLKSEEFYKNQKIEDLEKEAEYQRIYLNNIYKVIDDLNKGKNLNKQSVEQSTTSWPFTNEAISKKIDNMIDGILGSQYGKYLK